MALFALGGAASGAAWSHAEITAGPVGDTASTAARLEFQASGRGALAPSFECRLDGARWAACTSPVEFTGLDGGGHDFEVRLVEVLAWGARRRSTPEAIVAAWMRSPQHRVILLRAGFRDVGVDVVRGTPRPGRASGGTFVAEFGRRG